MSVYNRSRSFISGRFVFPVNDESKRCSDVPEGLKISSNTTFNIQHSIPLLPNNSIVKPTYIQLPINHIHRLISYYIVFITVIIYNYYLIKRQAQKRASEVYGFIFWQYRLGSMKQSQNNKGRLIAEIMKLLKCWN